MAIPLSQVGIVVIGRNEGERLKRCLASLSAIGKIVYVDSNSTDGSVQWAREHGVQVIELDINYQFTAARARNCGFRLIRQIRPDISYIQFLDGDCELIKDWPAIAVSFLESHPHIGVVCGRLRELYPERSIYNWLCDREWDRPVGETSEVGGIAMTRVTAIQNIGGFREDLIAGEEPELCVRLRAAGWDIWRLDAEMALHDAAMTHFGQWWSRVVRSGFAFAQGAYLHGSLPGRHYVWESSRALLWGLAMPLACIIICVVVWPWGLMAWLIYPLQVFRQILRNSGSVNDRATIAFFQVLGRFPEVVGAVKFLLSKIFSRQVGLIEYK
jgi:GT2 family glycosyltransferase